MRIAWVKRYRGTQAFNRFGKMSQRDMRTSQIEVSLFVIRIDFDSLSGIVYSVFEKTKLDIDDGSCVSGLRVAAVVLDASRQKRPGILVRPSAGGNETQYVIQFWMVWALPNGPAGFMPGAFEISEPTIMYRSAGQLVLTMHLFNRSVGFIRVKRVCQVTISKGFAAIVRWILMEGQHVSDGRVPGPPPSDQHASVRPAGFLAARFA